MEIEHGNIVARLDLATGSGRVTVLIDGDYYGSVSFVLGRYRLETEGSLWLPQVFRKEILEEAANLIRGMTTS